jgi:hypothetical protein
MNDKPWEKALWWTCLGVAPLVLAAMELFHPSGFTHDPGMYAYLSKAEPYDPRFDALTYFGPQWWFILHMVQTPLVCLVAVGMWLLVRPVSGADGAIAALSARVSRAATFVFAIYYTALDAIGGFGLARTILVTRQMSEEGSLTAEQLDGVIRVLDATWTDPWVGGVGSFVSLTGSWAVFVAALSGAIALAMQKRVPWPPLVLLVLFGWELQVSHTMPHGPIAFTLLLIGSAWIRHVESRNRG